MSAWTEMADAIKNRLESLVLMDGIDVVVDRQTSIDSKVKVAVGKAKGALVTILLNRGGTEKDASPMVTSPGYLIRLYTRAVIRDSDSEAVPADDLLQAMMPALNGWHPNPRAHSDDALYVTDGFELMPSVSYLIYEFPVACRVTLPVPQFKP